MPATSHAVSLEEQVDQWRSFLRRRQAIHSVDVAELEDHLREQIAVLVDAGLAPDEAFLVAVKRMGNLDALSREFAREHSDRLWKQLVVVPSESGDPRPWARTDASPASWTTIRSAVRKPKALKHAVGTESVWEWGDSVHPKLAGEFVKLGARYVSTGTDLSYLLSAATARAKQMREL